MSSFGVSVTTMEEVFIKVGEDSGESLDERCDRNHACMAASGDPLTDTGCAE